jgi:rhodanese-related sulfurtransferase
MFVTLKNSFMKTIHRVASTLLFGLILLSCSAQQKNNLTADEFEKAITKDSVQILDVRTPEEYMSGHIKNTLLANWNDKAEFSRRVAFVDKNKPVYIYCLAGGRSAAAAKQLRTEGFENVIELSGGINAWKAANKPLEGKTDEKQMTEEAFNTAISGKTVLVDFGATWCPPCKKMEPVIKSLQSNNANHFELVKVDGGKDLDLLKKYGVTALPVFIVFKNGKQVWRKDGVATEKEMAEALQP